MKAGKPTPRKKPDPLKRLTTGQKKRARDIAEALGLTSELAIKVIQHLAKRESERVLRYYERQAQQRAA